MKIKNITIEMELNEKEIEAKHASKFVFENDAWEMNGKIFSRFGTALNEICKLLKGDR